MDEQYKRELIYLAEAPRKREIKTLQAEVERLKDEIDTLQHSETWRIDERERAFTMLGADDYPNGDLCDWIRPLLTPPRLTPDELREAAPEP